MSTINDVARAAGVSVATVSRALRGLDRVSPQTRARVVQAATELHYVASPTASSLASGRTKVVAVVVPFLARWFFATVISGIEKALRRHDHHVLLIDLEGESFGTRLHLSHSMLWKRVDGVIVLATALDEQEQALIERLGLPVVTIGHRIRDWSCVRIDDKEAMRIAVRHVLDLGHTDVAYVGGVPDASADLQTPQDRARAFADTLAERGLGCPPEWVIESDWTAVGAARDIMAVLNGPSRPTAVVAASDEMALGVMAAARRSGLAVPQDLSVIGVDDHVLSEALGLTTVRQDVLCQGHRAGEALMRQLVDEAAATVDEVMPVQLVVRESTAPPPKTRGGTRVTNT
ncbi:LacI family transcriptional regulator [Micromonospora globispora]|uniref:LacI family transcriptional regulator n=1 Tax=Micromonospora globispora TaxID=1450148 RepID=A0A317K9U5_9ACTN|nr:LacI family DNA-binding transcriptional regulator [Micromonospora globispora]PWU48778.1 LacI family transcriptional regulator [Micromonospora globispora]PWU60499.1 LacI family transcriptional regulator [Micromonospora globispora]